MKNSVNLPLNQPRIFHPSKLFFNTCWHSNAFSHSKLIFSAHRQTLWKIWNSNSSNEITKLKNFHSKWTKKRNKNSKTSNCWISVESERGKCLFVGLLWRFYCLFVLDIESSPHSHTKQLTTTTLHYTWAKRILDVMLWRALEIQYRFLKGIIFSLSFALE